MSSNIRQRQTDMCGIIGYIGKQEAAPVIINGLKKLEYRGPDLLKGYCKDFCGHMGWANETLIKFAGAYKLREQITMKILNIIRKEHYYVLVGKEFRRLLESKIGSKKKLTNKLNISRKTLYRIRKREGYWCNVQTLLNLCKDVGISNRQLISNIQKIKTKNSFPIRFKNLRLTSSFARILGHILGDGGIHIIKNENKYRAFYVNNENRLLNSFRSCVKAVFGDVKIYFRRREEHGDEIWLPSTIGYLLYTLLEYDRFGEKRVPGIIRDSENKRVLSAFLQAIYDDEGFVYPKKKMIVIAQVKYDLLKDVRELVLRLGINANQILVHRSKERSTMYYFSITHRDNISKFKDMIGFLHPTKGEKLHALVKGYR